MTDTASVFSDDVALQRACDDHQGHAIVLLDAAATAANPGPTTQRRRAALAATLTR